MKLRDYQLQCVEANLEAFSENSCVLNVMPTGTGKTITFAETIARYCLGGVRAMVVAHREELIHQAVDKIEQVTGLVPDVEMAEVHADNDSAWGRAKVVVSTIQTQIAGKIPRMKNFNPMDFKLLVVDEAHHATSQSYRRVIDHYLLNDECKVLGVTATPDRADEAALGKVFDICAFEYGLVDAINDGWLVEIEQQYIEVEGLDFSKIRTTAGDLNQGELAQVMLYEEILHRSIVPTLEIAGDRKTLLFAASVAHAERMSEIINRYGKTAAIIHGTTPKDERRDILRRYHDGQIQMLCNCMIATEGFDVPSIEVVAICRPTKSRALYAQMIGRGTRPLTECVPFLNDCHTPSARRSIIQTSSKPSMTVLDYAGNSGRHKLVSTADILGGNYDDEVIEAARATVLASEKPVPMREALDHAAEVVDERRRKAREVVLARAKWSAKMVSPFDVFAIKPRRERGWERGKRPTSRMIALLDKAGVGKIEGLSFADAGRIIQELKRRWGKDLCSYKQARLLKKFGEDPEVDFKAATAKIDAIQRNNWKPLANPGGPRKPLVMGQSR